MLRFWPRVTAETPLPTDLACLLPDGAVTTPPLLRSAEGVGLLGQALSREAAILGFNDSFRLITFIALCTALFLAGVIIRINWQSRHAAPKGVQQ